VRSSENYFLLLTPISFKPGPKFVKSFLVYAQFVNLHTFICTFQLLKYASPRKFI